MAVLKKGARITGAERNKLQETCASSTTRVAASATRRDTRALLGFVHEC